MFELVLWDCLDCLVYLCCFGLRFGLFGWSRFDCLNLFLECLYSLDCFYCFLDLFELFALFVFFDGLDWLCDAKLLYLFVLFIGVVWTVCIVSMVILNLGFISAV